MLFATTILLLAAANVSASGTAEVTPYNTPNAADEAAIQKLLANYTRSVSTGDRAAFESQLLDPMIPFSYVKQGSSAVSQPGLAAFQDYAGFRKVIFDSGKRYQQRFSHIHIEQLGNLAQVSLDYQTALQGEAYAGAGWKVMQLVRINGQWKIASELYTGYPAK